MQSRGSYNPEAQAQLDRWRVERPPNSVYRNADPELAVLGFVYQLIEAAMFQGDTLAEGEFWRFQIRKYGRQHRVRVRTGRADGDRFLCWAYPASLDQVGDVREVG